MASAQRTLKKAQAALKRRKSKASLRKVSRAKATLKKRRAAVKLQC